MIHKTVLTTDAMCRWLGEHVLVRLQQKFPSPDYRFVLEMTQHVMNGTCRTRHQQVHVVCHTNFQPAPTLVLAWISAVTLN